MNEDATQERLLRLHGVFERAMEAQQWSSKAMLRRILSDKHKQQEHEQEQSQGKAAARLTSPLPHHDTGCPLKTTHDDNNDSYNDDDDDDELGNGEEEDEQRILARLGGWDVPFGSLDSLQSTVTACGGGGDEDA